MFSYEPIANESEAIKAREFPLLPDGVYDFAVMKAEHAYSSKGNHMIQLVLRIIHEGVDHNVYCNLIGTKNMEWLTKHFCETTGLKEYYLNKKFNEKLCHNVRGKCLIGTQQAKPKNDGSGDMWKARNVVDDFCGETFDAEQLNKAPLSPTAVNDFHDDALPF